MKIFGLEISLSRASSSDPVSPPEDTSSPINRKMATGQRRMVIQAAQTTRLEQSWTASPETADAIIDKTLRTVVARSRDQAINNDHAKAYLRAVRNNVIGHSGILLKSTPRDPSGKMDEAAKEAIEAAWKNQSKKGNWDVTGQFSRVDFERLAIAGAATDGAIVAVIVTGKDAGPTGFAVQLMDSMRLDPQHNEKLTGGRFIRHGIEFNQYGRPLAYHFIEEDPSIPLYASAYYGRTYVRVDAERVVHCFIPELVGQKRGFPWMMSALWRLRMLKGFDDAALTNARVGAAKGGFFRDPQGELEADGDLTMDAEPGTFENIGGLDFVAWNPQFPEQSIEQFVRVNLRAVAASIGLSYSTLSGDLSDVNFSSLRQGVLDERSIWLALQEWFITNFERIIFEKWLERSILAGSIKVKGAPLRLDRLEKYQSAEFRGRRWSWVDPKVEIEAAKMAVEARLASRSDFIEDWTGGDAWDTFEKISQEEKDMKSLGVEVMTTPGAGVMGEKKPTEKKDAKKEPKK